MDVRDTPALKPGDRLRVRQSPDPRSASWSSCASGRASAVCRIASVRRPIVTGDKVTTVETASRACPGAEPRGSWPSLRSGRPRPSRRRRRADTDAGTHAERPRRRPRPRHADSSASARTPTPPASSAEPAQLLRPDAVASPRRLPHACPDPHPDPRPHPRPDAARPPPSPPRPRRSLPARASASSTGRANVYLEGRPSAGTERR